MAGKSVTELQVRQVVPELGRPLTHLSYCSLVSQAAQRGEVLRPYVQVRRRGKVVLCGRVDRLGEQAEEGDWFKVSTEIGTVWAESQNVRLCSGDGRCTCEAAPSLRMRVALAPAARTAGVQPVENTAFNQGGFFQAGVVAPPERLTGETFVVL